MRRLTERQQADLLYLELRKPPPTLEEQQSVFVPPPPLGAHVAAIRDGIVAEQHAIDGERDKALPDLWGGGETNG